MTKVMHGATLVPVTKGGYSETDEGAVPHLLHPSGLWMPCKIVTTRGKDGKAERHPARRPDGSVIYMLPGHKEFYQ